MTRIYTIAALLTGGSLTHLFRMRTTHFPESWIQDLTAAQQREELEKRGERALLKKRERWLLIILASWLTALLGLATGIIVSN